MAKLFAKNKKIENINLFDKKVYSQNGEDGIINIIFRKIGTTNKFCVEFGAGDGHECNTRYLIKKKKWKYLHMDTCHCSKTYTIIKHEFITAENINNLFRQYKVPKKFDLLSIDVDFNDYWIWKAIKEEYKPRVVIVEYNASIPATHSKTVPYSPYRVWDGTRYYGASLLALAKLGKTKGYTLVGCDKNGVNAFFVRSDLAEDNFTSKTVKELYRPPKWGGNVKRYLSPKDKFISV